MRKNNISKKVPTVSTKRADKLVSKGKAYNVYSGTAANPKMDRSIQKVKKNAEKKGYLTDKDLGKKINVR
jgi:hypothetical protein